MSGYWIQMKRKKSGKQIISGVKSSICICPFLESSGQRKRNPGGYHQKSGGTLYSGRGICRKHSHTDAGKRRKRVPCDRT